MCLTLRTPRRLSYEPYNDSRIRYKVAYISRLGDLTSQYRNASIKRRGVNRGSLSGRREIAGIHVYVSIADVIPEMSLSKVLLRVKVSGFLASGLFRGTHSETWKSYRVLAVIRKVKRGTRSKR